MKFYRFMSMREFVRMMNGGTIDGRHNHMARTTSHGICFLGEFVQTDYKAPAIGGWQWCGVSCSPADAFEFLSGIVSKDIIVEFEADPANFTESVGVYAVPEEWGANWDSLMTTQEFTVPSYNRENCVPLRFAFPGEWHWYNF